MQVPQAKSTKFTKVQRSRCEKTYTPDFPQVTDSNHCLILFYLGIIRTTRMPQGEDEMQCCDALTAPFSRGNKKPRHIAECARERCATFFVAVSKETRKRGHGPWPLGKQSGNRNHTQRLVNFVSLLRNSETTCSAISTCVSRAVFRMRS